MDFLKMLLAYMALLGTLSVQEGPQPQAVPTPTQLPPSVTATLVPYQTEAPTATPAPTSEPVPTITPNSRYETVRYQDRGSAVKKLQNRLIELGYMPKGSADGAYGYQTYNAVKEFQRINGLEVDGTAGPATLTNLYENPLVLPKATPTTAPTATPTMPLPTPELEEDIPLPAATAVQTAVEDIALPDAIPAPVHTAAAFSLTEVPDALIISGNTGMQLTITEMVDDEHVLLKPALWVNGDGEPVMSLRDLVDCYPDWTLVGSSADGVYTLQAAGYEVVMQLGEETIVTVDGQAAAVSDADAKLHNGVVYVNGRFLEETIGATVIFDADERSLVLFIRDKSAAEAND